jgi:hypothetical protein
VIVGFTGTQKGMTGAQKFRVGMMLEDSGVRRAHHGACVGADDEFDYLCSVRDIWRYLHPSNIRGKQAYCEDRPGVTHLLDEKPPLERNQDIVDASDVLIAAPAGFGEEVRSGTWSTVRRARKRGIPVAIVWPDGTFLVENAA